MAGLVQQSVQSDVARLPERRVDRAGSRYLSPFDNLFAPVVASWPRTTRELAWLAPGTLPPLTPAKVCAWKRTGGRQYLFWDACQDGPCGYCELNRMPDERRRYWVGHFIIDPARRGTGLSHVFFRNLVLHAFEDMGAAEVLLVVVPENVAAIRCYERGGMITCGRESKRFDTTGRKHTFLRMSITRKRYERAEMYHDVGSFRAPFVRSAVSLLNGQRQ